MAWYYMNGSERQGPFEEAAFEELKAKGEVSPEAYVWADGMADWKMLKDISSADSGGPRCAECGKEFPESELISYQGVKICADCKPKFLEKIKAGLPVGGMLPLAGLGLRLGAAFLDGIILYVAQIPFSILGGVFALTMEGRSGEAQVAGAMAQIATYAISMAIGIGYEVIMVAKYEATLGKKVCGLKVVRSDGSRLSWGRSFGRHFGKYLSYLLCCVGYLMVLWDVKRQALHDHMADTLVVKA